MLMYDRLPARQLTSILSVSEHSFSQTNKQRKIITVITPILYCFFLMRLMFLMLIDPVALMYFTQVSVIPLTTLVNIEA